MLLLLLLASLLALVLFTSLDKSGFIRTLLMLFMLERADLCVGVVKFVLLTFVSDVSGGGVTGGLRGNKDDGRLAASRALFFIVLLRNFDMDAADTGNISSCKFSFLTLLLSTDWLLLLFLSTSSMAGNVLESFI